MAKHGNTSRVAASAHSARARNARLLKALLLVVIVCAVFVAGFTVRGDAALLEAIGFSSLSTDSDSNPSLATSGDTYDSIGARVTEVEGILESDSLDSYDLDTTTTDVLDAFTDSTQDTYLRYFDRDRYAELLQDTSGSYAGIGVLFSEYLGRAYAVDVFDGSVAQAANVHEGDFVVAINGDREHDWSQAEVVGAMRAYKEGDSVVITWRRPASLEAEGGEEFTTTLVCSAYQAENVGSDLVDSVGYITLKQLTANSSTLVRQAVTNLTAQGATSFVLDIRDNPGGYLTQAVDIASLFVKSGTIVKIQAVGNVETTKTATGATVTDAPLVVLMNGNTAAAAEVLAAGLQDNQRATLVGTTTLGKGSVQVMRELSFGGALRYTAAYYKSPQGHDINGVGVAPNVTVNQEANTDSQRAFALEAAQNLAQR